MCLFNHPGECNELQESYPTNCLPVPVIASLSRVRHTSIHGHPCTTDGFGRPNHVDSDTFNDPLVNQSGLLVYSRLAIEDPRRTRDGLGATGEHA
jgi:hypothetical protein